jgi:hypothetical protein
MGGMRVRRGNMCMERSTPQCTGCPFDRRSHALDHATLLIIVADLCSPPRERERQRERERDTERERQREKHRKREKREKHRKRERETQRERHREHRERERERQRDRTSNPLVSDAPVGPGTIAAAV